MYDVNTHDVRRFFADVWRQCLASLHLSIQEQSDIDQPPGIRAIHHKLQGRYAGDWVRAGHDMMDALAEKPSGARSATGKGWM